MKHSRWIVIIIIVAILVTCCTSLHSGAFLSAEEAKMRVQQNQARVESEKQYAEQQEQLRRQREEAERVRAREELARHTLAKVTMHCADQNSAVQSKVYAVVDKVARSTSMVVHFNDVPVDLAFCAMDMLVDNHYYAEYHLASSILQVHLDRPTGSRFILYEHRNDVGQIRCAGDYMPEHMAFVWPLRPETGRDICMLFHLEYMACLANPPVGGCRDPTLYANVEQVHLDQFYFALPC